MPFFRRLVFTFRLKDFASSRYPLLNSTKPFQSLSNRKLEENLISRSHWVTNVFLSKFSICFPYCPFSSVTNRPPQSGLSTARVSVWSTSTATPTNGRHRSSPTRTLTTNFGFDCISNCGSLVHMESFSTGGLGPRCGLRGSRGRVAKVSGAHDVLRSTSCAETSASVQSMEVIAENIVMVLGLKTWCFELVEGKDERKWTAKLWQKRKNRRRSSLESPLELSANETSGLLSEPPVQVLWAGLVLKSVKSVASFIVQSRRSVRWWFFRSVGTLCGQSWQSSDRLWLWVVALGRMSRATPRRRPAPPSSPIPVQHVFNPCHSAPIASPAHCIDTVRASVLRSRGMYAGARPGMLKVHTTAV